MWPQFIVIILVSMGLGASLLKHGEIKPVERWHFGRDLLYGMITLVLLYWGGFFDCFLSS